MAGETPWRLGNRPVLDSVRAVALGLVVLDHAGVPGMGAAGVVGVTVFFTLSGFLITALLLEEHGRTGSVDVFDFYRRRTLRLLPALVLFLAVMSALGPISGKAASPTSTDVLGSLFYVGNFVTGLQGKDNVLLHTWSLAVEEQFYIVWPLVLMAALASRRCARSMLVSVALVGIAMAWILRWSWWDGGAGHLLVYYGTLTRIDALLMGVLVAVWLTSARTYAPRFAVGGLALAAAAALSGVSFAAEHLFLPLVVPVLTAVAIIFLVRGPAPPPRSVRWVELVGQRSYAAYLWHFPIVGTAAQLEGPWRWPAMALALALTGALTHLSWRCVEEPFLRRKKHRLPTGADEKSEKSSVQVAPAPYSV